MSTNEVSRRSILIEFFLLSAVSLFIELLIIRWMSADIRAFSVFKTFPLVACFIGLGAGYALANNEFFKTTPWAMLFFAAIMKIADLAGISLLPFPTLSIFYWQNVLNTPADLWTRVAIFAASLLLLIGAPFALMLCIGTRLGILFNEFAPLPAYCINIGGAILGSLAFALFSFCGLSPGFLMLVPAVIIVLYSSRGWNKQLLTNSLAAAASIIFATSVIAMDQGATTYWSPYQRLDLVPYIANSNLKDKQPTIIAYNLFANRVPYQFVTDWQAIKNQGVTLNPDQIGLLEKMQRRFKFPFAIHPPGDVLVVGAGMGNDVAAALAANMPSIDAVDIDPIIQKLGQKYHPLHPYDSAKVKMICNDARNFFTCCHKTYDIVVFSHIDSHVVTAGSSLRIDNFIYTKQSFQNALALLKPGGLAVVSFYSVKPWFSDRLYKTIHEAIGYQPLEFTDRVEPSLITFVFGPSVANHTFTLPAELAKQYVQTTKHQSENIRLLTDDWPYIYVTPGLVDVPYLLIVAEAMLLALFIGWRTLKPQAEPLNWQMFFLGAAFMLLELQAISRLSLVYGATWLTAAIVINGVLIMILIANLVVIQIRNALSTKIGLLYALLFCSLIASYIFPNYIDQVSEIMRTTRFGSLNHPGHFITSPNCQHYFCCFLFPSKKF